MAYISTAAVKVIRADLKAAFPDWKFSVRKDVNSHSSITVSILKSDLDFQWSSGYANTEQYMSINHYHPQVTFSGNSLTLIKEVIGTINKENWDRSDIQTDYFDVGFYVNVEMGRYGRPYINAGGTVLDYNAPVETIKTFTEVEEVVESSKVETLDEMFDDQPESVEMVNAKSALDMYLEQHGTMINQIAELEKNIEGLEWLIANAK